MDNKGPIRTLLLLRYLFQNSDETHPVSAGDILAYWESCGIHSDRRRVYHDIALLQEFGIDIVRVKSKQNQYFVGSRLFELPELKLLVDAVESSQFITPKKSRELIQKLGQMAGRKAEPAPLHGWDAQAEKRGYLLHRGCPADDDPGRETDLLPVL